MDIACPNCAATYRVPDTLVDGVNALRCVACGHAWVPDPPLPVQLEAEVPPPVPEPPPPPPPWHDPAPVDAGPIDPGPINSGPIDSGPVDSGPVVEAPPAAPPVERTASSLPPMRSDVTLTLTPTRAGPPELASHRRPEVPRRRRRQVRSALSAAWAISITLVIAFLMGLVVYHAQISAAWPPFARLAG